MGWIIFGTVFVAVSILAAHNQGFLFSSPWNSGFVTGAWAVFVFCDLCDRYRH